jgi:hypothetical protein
MMLYPVVGLEGGRNLGSFGAGCKLWHECTGNCAYFLTEIWIFYQVKDVKN